MSSGDYVPVSPRVTTYDGFVDAITQLVSEMDLVQGLRSLDVLTDNERRVFDRAEIAINGLATAYPELATRYLEDMRAGEPISDSFGDQAIGSAA